MSIKKTGDSKFPMIENFRIDISHYKEDNSENLIRWKEYLIGLYNILNNYDIYEDIQKYYHQFEYPKTIMRETRKMLKTL